MWETRLGIVDWVYSKTQILLETLMKTLNQLGGESYVIFRRVEHLFPQVGRAKKQTSVSHSSTELEIIPLDPLVCEWTDSLILTNGMW